MNALFLELSTYGSFNSTRIRDPSSFGSRWYGNAAVRGVTDCKTGEKKKNYIYIKCFTVRSVCNASVRLRNHWN